MNIFQWFFRGRSARRAAMSLYKRGLKRTKRHDQRGATEDFTAAIESPGAPHDLRAMALYNRALLFAGADNSSAAIDDLNAILAMADSLREIKIAARRRLDRMQHQRSVAGCSTPHLKKFKGLRASVAG